MQNDQIDTGTAKFSDAMAKLRMHRCDIVLGRWEIAAGHRLTNGVDYTHDDAFGYARIPGMASVTFHMLVNRRMPYARELLDIIDSGTDGVANKSP